VNSGGEPERDDTGLPPVDIEIPDDARELDRDVQAYYREQRAERRRLRHRRVHGILTRDGILLPLLACCLILALITGTLLTVFTATSNQSLVQLPRYPASTSPPHTGGPTAGGRPATPSPHVVQTRGPLPAGVLSVAGHRLPVSLQSLGQTLLVLVPSGCRCSAAVNWLAGIGASHRAQVYLVGTSQTINEAKQLHSQLPASLQTRVPVALDKLDLLAQKYPLSGLTAVMVTRPAGHSPAGQSAAYAQHLSANDSSAPLVQALGG